MTTTDFILGPPSIPLEKGSFTYRAPSNIALVKYWGKRADQMPANPSLSFTLDACATTTTLSYAPKESGQAGFSFDLLFEGRAKDSFKPKIATFLERIAPYVPFVQDHHFTIETSNSFPHSSGIASSASGMAALALCLMEMERQCRPDMAPDFFLAKASFLARLGSGSACRSITGRLVHWGHHSATPGSTDLYGIPYPHEVHPVFASYHDTILLVDKGQKQVSSTVGHELMHDHPYAQSRFGQAHTHLNALQTIFKEGDLGAFMALVESEALTLHAMMMCSSPYFILMKPNTLQIIERIWHFRKTTGAHVCFTLDAGANVHVLYPAEEREAITQFIAEALAPLCENGQYIHDKVGQGALKL
jgi:diphosphomevalonate decarboxylase